MSTSSALNPLQFENHEDEINYWRNLSFALSKENEEFRQRIEGLTRKSLKPLESPTASPAAKRFKEDSMDLMDFSNICEDVQSLLMQHFNGKDLLTMSEVSKNWNKCVEAGISGKATLNLPEDIREYRNIGLTREYKHVSMKMGNISKLEALLKVANSAEDLKIVLEEEPMSFKSSVETLKIIVKEDKEDPINFPHLKSLELEVISNIEDFSWITKLQMDELEKLKIRTDFTHDQDKCPFCFYYGFGFLQSHDDFIKFFMSLNKLKSLDLYGSETDFLHTIKELFDESEYPDYKLETLRCRYVDEFDDFIDLGSLKSLAIKALDHDDISNALSRYDELTKLEIKFDLMDSFYNSTNEYPENKSIKDLTIIFAYVHTEKDILKATPEVENLRVYSLYPELVQFIAETNMKMKTVKYKSIVFGYNDEYDPSEEYEEMLQTQPNINRNIQFVQEDFDFDFD